MLADNPRVGDKRGAPLVEWLVQIGLFVVMFAIPCAVFVVSTIVGGELRDFFESTTLSLATHLLLSAVFGMIVYRLTQAMMTPEQTQYLGFVINIEFGLVMAGWVLGAGGCLYGDQAPSKRIGPRGIKRYR